MINSRTDLINYFIKKTRAKKYLEIGVEGGTNFSRVECEYKIGVDPDINSKATHIMTSDVFFKTNNEKFDVIFVDGLHHCDQAYKDILNSLNALTDGGYILCHDINPSDEISQRVPRMQASWTGDCWKALVKLRLETNDLKIKTVLVCSGIGIISKGKPKKISTIINEDPFKLEYEFLDKNRKELINLISLEEFLKEEAGV